MLALSVAPATAYANEGGARAVDGTSVADGSTINTWNGYVTENNTQTVGRIWTDKTVQAGDITLQPVGTTINKVDGADFLVGLSALSSTSNTSTTTGKPLDIVLVLDTSGSMAYGMDGSQQLGYEEVYAGQLDTGRIYYIRDGRSYQEVTFSSDENEWGYSNRGRWTSVTPRESQSDYRNTQFYEKESSRLEALQAAVKGFVSRTLEENQKQSDENLMHRIGIVTFSSGAETEQGLTTVTADAASAMNTTLDSLRANGGTEADEGIRVAQSVVSSAREDAQKVVIFFTDGQPGNYAFDGRRAASVINTANTMKNDGTLVYTIGIFEGADPSDVSSKNNSYMNAASSNYPDATATGTAEQQGWFGSYEDGTLSVTFNGREEGADYYKAASDAGELENVFTEIFDSINTGVSSPTEVQEGFNGTNSGYITFTDALGDYMEVKGGDDAITVVFADQEYTSVRAEETADGLRYVFNSATAGNPVYPNGDIAHLAVTVQPGENGAGDTVTVKIPAELIPLRNYKVETKNGVTSMSTDEAYPIHVFYSVGLQENADALLAKPDKAMADYIENNSENSGEVSFYSNDYTKGSDTGNTTAEFSPAPANKFYYFTENTPLYADETCTVRATADDIESGSGTVYYKNDYYKQNGAAGELVPDRIAIPVTAFSSVHADNWGSDSEGAFMKAGVPRLNRTEDFNVVKGGDAYSNNATGTAAKYISPSWNDTEDGIVVSLGNNGKLTKEQPATLAVSKQVAAAPGFEGGLADYQQKSFTFNFSFTDVPDGDYQAEVKNAEGSIVGDPFTLFVQDGTATHALKHGETLYIYGLPANATYTVTEDLASMPGFTSEVTSGTAENGALAAGQTVTVEFTNTYQAASVDLPADTVGVKKNLSGRNWRDTDAFAFGIGAQGMPAFENAKVTIDDATADHQASFGKVTFGRPGTYTYYVWEYNPENPDAGVEEILGVDYSDAQYRVVIEVRDNGNGALEIASTEMTQIQNDAGQPIEPATRVEGNVATFTNTYGSENATARVAATKNYIDNSGGNPLANGMFEVTLTPTGGYRTDAGSAESTVSAENVPMPKNEAGDVVGTVGNVDRQFSFPLIEFDSENVGYTYTYTLSEVDKDAAGMEYDKSVHTVTITVTEEEDADGAAVIKAAVSPASVEFTNTYNPVDATLSGDAAIGGTKTLTGREAKDDDTFEFTLKPAAGNTLDGVVGITAEGLTAAVKGPGVISEVPFTFGGETGITFSKVGMYAFEMKEVVPEADSDGMTWDRHTCTVTVEVRLDKETGTLTATPSYGAPASNAFTNNYAASVDYGTDAGGIVVSKVLNGRTMEPGEFSFAIAGDEGKLTEADKGFSNPERRADGVSIEMEKLQSLTFDQDDAGKTFSFIVSETKGDAPGVVYDEAKYVVDIEVVDNGDGTMHAFTAVTKYADGNTDGTGEVVLDEASSAAEGYAAPVLSFANAYQPGEVTIDSEADNALAVTKKVEGAPATEAFNFELTLTDGDASAVFEGSGVGKTAFDGVSATTAANLADGATETLKFGDITFTKKGTYTFQVKETNQAAESSGWTYDNEPKTITVVVTDKAEDGSYADALRIKSVTGSNPTVTNSYKAAPVVVGGEGAEQSLTVQKTVVGRDSAEDFSFTLAPVDEGDAKWANVEPLEGFEAAAVVSEDFKAGEVKRAAWGAVSFNAAGTYEFTVVEDQGDEGANGWTYDNHAATIVVTVTDEGFDGQLDASIEYKNDGAKTDADKAVTDAATFTNSYTASAFEGVPTGFGFTKVLEGKEWAEGDVFKFTLAAENGAPMPSDADGATKTIEVKKPESGNEAAFDFGDITYDEVGTYTYKVTEVAGDNAGIAYDDHEAIVTVNVKDDGNGKLSATAAVSGGSGDKFVNAYDTGEVAFDTAGGLEIVKNLTGRAIGEGDFVFTMIGADDQSTAKIGGTALEFSTKGAAIQGNAATETVAALTGLHFTKDDAGKEFAYTIAEKNGGVGGYTYDSNTHAMKFAVSHDGNGTLKVEAYVDGELQQTYTAAAAAAMANAPVVVTFDNAYDAGSVTVGGEGEVPLSATKTLTGRDQVAGEFEFVVKDKNGDEVLTGANVAATDGVAAPVNFGTITYTTERLNNDVAAGVADRSHNDETGADVYTYEYTVSENADALDEGVAAVEDAFGIKVLVTDSGTGTLTAEVVYPEGGMAFENTYGATAQQQVSVKGKKTLNAAEGLNEPDIAGKYQFTLTGEDGAPMPEGSEGGVKTVANDASGNVDFGKITYTMENVFGGAAEDAAGDGPEAMAAQREKTFTYTVTESGTVAGVANDAEAVKTVTVTVTDNGDGTLGVAKAADASGGDGMDFAFVNTYSVTPTDPVSPTDPGIEGAVKVTKTLTGRDLKADEFSFELVSDESGEVVASGVNDEDGNVSISGVVFDKPGTYGFELSEFVPDDPDQLKGGVTYDGHIYDVWAVVTDNGDGTMSVAWAPDGAEFVFENAYEPAPAGLTFNAAKVLEGRDLVESEFAFELRENGEVIGAATNDAAGKIAFERIEYTEAGEHEYEIVEVKGDAEGVTYDETAFAVSVDVVDGGEGRLTANWAYGENGAPVFENTYTAPEEPKPLPPADDGDGSTLVRTGDASPAALLASGALAAAVVACGTELRLRRSRRNGR